MDFKFNDQFYAYFGFDYHSAASFFGCSVGTVRRWLKGAPCPRAKVLLDIVARGYLPTTGPWSKCRIDKEGNLETPWGVCRPSDLSFVHRYKNTARLQTNVLKRKREESAQLSQALEELERVAQRIAKLRNSA